MIVKPIKTDLVEPGKISIFEVLDKSLASLTEKSIVVITSKVVALCEGRVVPIEGTDKEELIKQEADYYLPSKASKYDYHFAIIQNTMAAAAGIDESNGGGNYILWPKDPQRTVNEVRSYLKKRFGLKHVGVVVTDSTCLPLRWGTIGVALAHSGFKPLNSYVGKPDLYGRPFKVSRAGIASGLASAAVLVMGEGAEQTPLVVIEDIPFVEFQEQDPTPEDIADLFVEPEEDLYAPFLSSVEWKKGDSGSNPANR